MLQCRGCAAFRLPRTALRPSSPRMGCVGVTNGTGCHVYARPHVRVRCQRRCQWSARVRGGQHGVGHAGDQHRVDALCWRFVFLVSPQQWGMIPWRLLRGCSCMCARPCVPRAHERSLLRTKVKLASCTFPFFFNERCAGGHVFGPDGCDVARRRGVLGWRYGSVRCRR